MSRRKYDTPSHPWQGDRIKSENELIKKFGLKNKREVWKSQSQLRNFRQQARLLNARLRMADVQAEKEKDQLLTRLTNLGILNPNSNLNDILTLEVETLMNRRLQTQVYLKGLANSPKQARQFIVHGHISIQGRKVTIPGYLVKDEEEGTIEYNQYSSLTNELHPMRPKPKVDIAVDDSQVSRLISISPSDSDKADAKPEQGQEITGQKGKKEQKEQKDQKEQRTPETKDDKKSESSSTSEPAATPDSTPEPSSDSKETTDNTEKETKSKPEDNKEPESTEEAKE
jgi:small subunit ribosomal protein S4